MNAPCDLEAPAEPREEGEEITLRLGDILPRVPAHLLKPGPHDAMSQVRFSVEELAQKIARGRVSVPLDRLASACPEVFRDSSAFPGEQEIALPLQKLLEQVGVVLAKPPPANGLPGDPLPQARPGASPAADGGAADPPTDSPASPPVLSPRIAKAISTARQILGLFGRPNESAAQGDATEKVAEVNPPLTEAKSPPAVDTPAEPPSPSLPAPAAQAPPDPAVPPVPSATATVDSPAPAQPSPKPAPVPVPEGCISLRVLPIFRLLPVQVLRFGTLPPAEARMAVPLSTIDPQLAAGHVDIPLDDFIKALPEDLRDSLNPIPDTKVWIPLDEIFQNLPPDHLFYMPPLDFPTEPKAAPVEESPSAEAMPEHKEPLPTEAGAVEPAKALAGEPAPEAVPGQPDSPTPPPTQEAPPAIEPSPQPAPAAAEATPEASPEASLEGAVPPALAESISTPSAPEPASPPQEPTPEATAAPAPAESNSTPAATEPASPPQESTPEATTAPAPAESVPTPPAQEPLALPQEPTPEAIAAPAPAESNSTPAATEPASPPQEPTPEAAGSPAPAENISTPPDAGPVAPAPGAGAEIAPPSRAPWMRGFHVPPPRLFSGSRPPAETPSEPAPVEPPPLAAPTPEAKRTADFLAGQPGIFASAAFVQGAVFASADFPRKPDLDALRDFMGAFIDGARDSGRRLGWNRVLTLPCEQFHLTAVVRDTHFIVALHHDRVLGSATHETLITAADDLSKAAG